MACGEYRPLDWSLYFSLNRPAKSADSRKPDLEVARFGRLALVAPGDSTDLPAADPFAWRCGPASADQSRRRHEMRRRRPGTRPGGGRDGSRSAWRRVSRSLRAPQERATLSPPAIGSRREQSLEVRNRFSVIKAISQHPQRQRLSLDDRLGSRRALGQHPRKVPDLGNPTAVLFLFGLQKEHASFLDGYGSVVSRRGSRTRGERSSFHGVARRPHPAQARRSRLPPPPGRPI